jgi:precorrin-6B methylase 2
MKFSLIALIFTVLIFATGMSWAQGFRVVVGGSANSLNSGAAQRFSQFGRAHSRGVVIGQTQPSRFLAPPGRFGSPRFIPGHALVHLRPRHFPKGSGILIIDVPRVVGTTVTVETTRGLTVNDPRLTQPHTGKPWQPAPGRLAPFDPTPAEVVDRMLRLAEIKKDDILYDLGSGDGRVVIAAAKKYGVRAVGIEFDPGLVKLARENLRKEGLEDLVEIRQQDFMTADLSLATVVTLYLSQEGNLTLRPKLMRELRPGARVVSYAFDMGDWEPKIVETYRDKANDTHLLYFWTIIAPMASYEPR